MIPSQRHLFDIPREVAYLNCAYMSPLTHSAVEAGRNAIAGKARPWNTSPADFITGPDHARNLFARLIGADADGVALAPSASYGIAVAAANLAPGAAPLGVIICQRPTSRFETSKGPTIEASPSCPVTPSVAIIRR